MFLRRLLQQQRWILPLAAAFLLLAQIGAVTHSLHLDSAQSDVGCTFCVAGAHIGTAPAVPVITAPATFIVAEIFPADSVCESLPLLTPRSSRGPPLI